MLGGMESNVHVLRKKVDLDENFSTDVVLLGVANHGVGTGSQTDDINCIFGTGQKWERSQVGKDFR